jgi:hypothetical protein
MDITIPQEFCSESIIPIGSLEPVRNTLASTADFFSTLDLLLN